ncbi:MAG: hypothetical protein H5U07_10610 [Candidatus Aminicenantes bacterium]|nr:hypothetical protein [Candidatus Aminicenantes bacterium]
MKEKTGRSSWQRRQKKPGWIIWLWAAGLLLFFGLVAVPPSQAQAGHLAPQFGFEGYGGSNQLTIFSPWVGARLGLARNASFILRAHYSRFGYEYWGSDGLGGQVKKDLRADIGRMSGAFYLEGKRLTGYVSFAYLIGSRNYNGFFLDSGLEWKISSRASALVSVYGIREKSNLWHPEEPLRWINTYSLRLGTRVWIFPQLAVNPNVYLIRNSEKVKSSAYSVGLVYTPQWWLAVTAYYFRYGEAAFYVFHGNYLSFGVNFYF